MVTGLSAYCDGLDSKLDINVIMLSVAMLAVVNDTSQQAGQVKCVAEPSPSSSILNLIADYPPSLSITSVQVKD